MKTTDYQKENHKSKQLYLWKFGRKLFRWEYFSIHLPGLILLSLRFATVSSVYKTFIISYESIEIQETFNNSSNSCWGFNLSKDVLGEKLSIFNCFVEIDRRNRCNGLHKRSKKTARATLIAFPQRYLQLQGWIMFETRWPAYWRSELDIERFEWES